MSSPYISLKDLTLAYGDMVAVPKLNFSCDKGELIALLGPSGCGKTTTMRSIAGLLAPQSGQVYIDGKDVTNVPANKREIGLMFQSYALFPHLSGFENVAFGLRIKKLPEAEIVEKTNKGLDTVGLLHLANRKPSEMSGGQQQRLALARSMVMEPKVLLLDEPLSNLDARLRLEMRAELQRVQRETGITMIFVTHDQSEALALADRIVLMKDGLIEQIGTPDELYNKPTSVFAADFLGFENIFEVSNNIIIGDTGKMSLDFKSESGQLAWRPSGVKIGEGTYKAVVKSVAFAGERREYVLQADIGEIMADVSAQEKSYKIGESLAFDLPQSKAHFIEQAS